MSKVVATDAEVMSRDDFGDKGIPESAVTKEGLDPGMTANVIKQVETHAEFLQRVLAADEKVVATFDCVFPGKFIPMWKIVVYLIASFGLYAFILLFRAIQRCCYRARLCTPRVVDFKQGKMAVTNFGRVICWKETVFQEKVKEGGNGGLGMLSVLLCGLDKCCKCCCAICCAPITCLITFIKKCCCRDLCQAPVVYETLNFYRIYSVANIRQITQYFNSEAACIWCCLDYECGVEIAFNSYNHGSNHLTIASRAYYQEDEIENPAQTAVSSSDLGTYKKWARVVYDKFSQSLDVFERVLGATSNLSVLKVLSNTNDKVHNGNVDSCLRDLCDLHKKLLECLPPLTESMLPVVVDGSDIKLNQGTVRGNLGGRDSKVEFTSDFKNVTIVKNDGTVSIPSDWMPLLPGEVVIAATGQVPRMIFCEWVDTICSLGMNYCLLYRKRKYTRSAIVLTNKRLLSIDIYERSGTIPLTLSNFSIQVRSYILGDVTSGYVRSDDPRRLEAGIEACGGAINIQFTGTGRQAIGFALTLQMSKFRYTKQIPPSSLQHLRKNVAIDASVELKLLPLQPGEQIVDWIKGDKKWEKCCKVSSSGLWNRLRLFCCCRPVAYACSPEACDGYDADGQLRPHCFFPCIPYILSCGILPYRETTDLIFTNMSIFRMQRKGNYGCCGMNDGCTTLQGAFMISWEPLESLTGFNVAATSWGKENFWRRLCACIYVGKFCCPVGHSELDVGIDLNGRFNWGIHRHGVNKVWITDPDLAATHSLLSGLQIVLNKTFGSTYDKEKDKLPANGPANV